MITTAEEILEKIKPDNKSMSIPRRWIAEGEVSLDGKVVAGCVDLEVQEGSIIQVGELSWKFENGEWIQNGET